MGILSWGFGEWKQRFSDCVAEVYAILCSCKEGLCQESTLRGVPPRSEIHYVTARSGGDIMNSMRLRPPRPPGNGQAGSGSQQRQRTQRKKIRYSGQKTFVRQAARHDSYFGFPFEGKLRPQAVMRCRFRLRNRFHDEK